MTSGKSTSSHKYYGSSSVKNTTLKNTGLLPYPVILVGAKLWFVKGQSFFGTHCILSILNYDQIQGGFVLFSRIVCTLFVGAAHVHTYV